MSRILSGTRSVVLLGVIASLLLATALFIGALVKAVMLVLTLFTHLTDTLAVREFAIGGLELADVCLIATAFYIVGIGLYELFIGDVQLPQWLVVSSLDDLKRTLINLVIVVLGVSFVTEAAIWDGKTNLLPFGLAVALVIAALSFFGTFRLSRHLSSGARDNDAPMD